MWRLFSESITDNTYKTGWTISSGLYDLITTEASLVQNTWDKSAPYKLNNGNLIFFVV